VASVELAEQFNQQVECDLLFIYKFIIFHLLCRCTRWNAAKVIPNREASTLISALNDTWVTIHGPMKELIVDGETGIAEPLSSGLFLARKGIKLVTRAPDQHARYIERRGALTRDVVHKIDTQLREEGLTEIPFELRLSEAVFAGNALVSINNTTPYNAVYGRVPNMLPDINQMNSRDGESDSDDLPQPGIIRHSHRLREIAIQQMVEGTARARINRAMRTKTLPAGQKEEYQVGDLVDFYRPPGSKDITGWSGPATVTDITRLARGVIGIRFQSKGMICKLGELRRHLSFLIFQSAYHSAMHQQQTLLSEARTLVDKTPIGELVHLGWMLAKDGKWRLTEKTKRFSKAFHLLHQVAYQCCNLENCVAMRYGRGISTLSPMSGHTHSVLLWWTPSSEDQPNTYEYDCCEQLNMRQFLPELERSQDNAILRY